jgi:hypothetical protein
MYGTGQEMKRNMQLNQQRQARLAQGVSEAQAVAAMRELTAKDRKHRLRLLLRTFTGRRARRGGGAVQGDRSWDH